MNSGIYSVSVPKITELFYYQAHIDFNTYNCAKRYLSSYNSHKIVARKIAATRDDVLVAPIIGKMSQIHLIVLLKSSEISNLCVQTDDVNLILTGPYSLHRAVYLECIHFTLTTRLTLNWNRICNYYVKSERFLKNYQPVDAVKLEMLLADERLVICPKPLRLKLPILDFDDINTIDLEKFKNEGFADVHRKVYVLPNLTPATAFKVYSKLPNFCPFDNYSELKDYWNVLHGCDLPENENNMAYVEVKFGFSNMTYLYPIICVLAYEPLQLLCKNQNDITNDFLESVKKEFFNIFGRCFRLKTNTAENAHNSAVRFRPASEVLATTRQHFQTANANEIEFWPELNKTTDLLQVSFRSTSDNNMSVEKKSSKTLNETFKCVEKFTPKSRIRRPQPPYPLSED